MFIQTQSFCFPLIELYDYAIFLWIEREFIQFGYDYNIIRSTIITIEQEINVKISICNYQYSSVYNPSTLISK